MSLDARRCGPAVYRPGPFGKQKQLQRKIKKMAASRPVPLGRRTRLQRKIKKMLTFRPLLLGRRRLRNRPTPAHIGRMQSRRRHQNQFQSRQSSLPKGYQKLAQPRLLSWTRTTAKRYTKKTRTRRERRPARKNCLRL